MMLNSNQKQEISRYDLKKELQGIESFDISSFGQSKNQSANYFKSFLNSHQNQSIFPTVNAPTLQLLQDSQYSIKYKGQNKNKKYQNNNKNNQYNNKYNNHDDLTARYNTLTNNHMYQEKIVRLNKLLEQSYQKSNQEKKLKQNLQEKIQFIEIQHKKQIEQLKQKNKQQKNQIKLLKERQIKIMRQKQILEKQSIQKNIKKINIDTHARQSRAYSTYSSSTTTLTTSFLEDPSSFSPELLSPEQTVLLLSKLLKKVSKSNKMIKQLTNDQSVKSILTKIYKKQN